MHVSVAFHTGLTTVRVTVASPCDLWFQNLASGGEMRMILRSLILTQYKRVTDRHATYRHCSGCSGPVVGALVQLVEYWTRNQEVVGSTHTRSTASNLEQVANLLCAQANSASYPQRDGK